MRVALRGLLLLWVLAGAGCRDVSAGKEAPPAGRARQLIVAIDLSASQTPEMLAEARRFLDQLIDGLSFGDRIVLLEIHQQGMREKVRRWADSMPAPADPSFVSSRDRERLVGARQALRSILPSFFDESRAGKAMRTDIFTTLHVAAEYAREARGRRTTLILLSDMLQSANGVEMQGLARMPEPGWIGRQKQAGLIPDLRGVCVVVVGADPTTREGVAVRDFWRAYFEAAGARLDLDDYRVIAPEGAEIGCH
jgi:hypothetical protein